MRLAIFDLKKWKEKYGNGLENAQAKKIRDELNELFLAINGKDQVERKLSECMDIIQSAKVYMDSISTEEQILKAYVAHEEKMKKYESSERVPKILGWVKLAKFDT